MNNIKLPWAGWKVTGLLGTGSYGRVYEIQRQQYGISEKEAVKILSFPNDPDEIAESLNSGGYVEATLAAEYTRRVQDVLKEYKLLKELGGNPHIVHCETYEAVPRPDGIGWDIYIKMELLTPLRRYLGKDVIREEQVTELGEAICSALSACWKKRVLHRDIKPENILVSEDGVYKLSDFGEARMVEKSMASGVAGTWSYVAPEVAKGSRYGETADIYSLGMVLYWMLNRCKLPFLSKPWSHCSLQEQEEARRRRLGGEPLPPPETGSRALQAVVLKACAYKPEDRYPTPESLSAALRRAAEGCEDDYDGDEDDYTGEEAMGNNWAAPAFDWGEPSIPAEDLEPTIPADGGQSSPQQKTAPAPKAAPAPETRSAPEKGTDMYREVTVTMAQAASGCKVRVNGHSGQKLQVTVPACTLDGRVLRCAGKGYPSYNGGENGDLYITVRVDKTPASTPPETPPKRTSAPDRGTDIYREVTITEEQASAGCKVPVEGSAGQTLQVTVPAGTQDADVLRCPGKGCPSDNGGENGDLYVTVRIEKTPEAAPPEKPKKEKRSKGGYGFVYIVALILTGEGPVVEFLFSILPILGGIFSFLVIPLGIWLGTWVLGPQETKCYGYLIDIISVLIAVLTIVFIGSVTAAFAAEVIFGLLLRPFLIAKNKPTGGGAS